MFNHNNRFFDLTPNWLLKEVIWWGGGGLETISSTNPYQFVPHFYKRIRIAQLNPIENGGQLKLTVAYIFLTY